MIFRHYILPLFLILWIPSEVLADVIIPKSNYRSPKNIAFASIGGGSSHHMWVFEILKEMHNRGHNVSFYSKSDQIHFSKGYPMIKAQEAGGSTDFIHHPLVAKHFSTRSSRELINLALLESCLVDYPTAFLEKQSLFLSNRINLAICDSFSIDCIDAAIISKIPVMITTTLGMFADFDASYINNKVHHSDFRTTQDDSFWTRLYRDYIETPFHINMLSRKVLHAHYFQRKIGLEPITDASAKRYNSIPKLVNNLFGIETARKHSPLMHMIGPILRNSYPALDHDSLEFLNNRKSIVYVAFGQHATPSDQDVKMILQSLLRLFEQKVIDGVIWAHLGKDQIPQIVQTINQEYSFYDIFNHQDILLPQWAPQFAILEHPSTSFFISHGGVGSMHESLFNGKRLFVYPMFGDQPGNARAIERIGVGKQIDTLNLKYDSKDYDRFYAKLYTVAVDPQNKIQDTVNRYKAYAQVSASNAVIRGADLMEESLFASDSQGMLYYRYDVGYEIHWVKRYNIDIYALFVVLSLCILKVGLMCLGPIRYRINLMPKLKSI
ncbi:hypothetical protein BDF21DRAFT_359667 [Thamnidium elegans]|nr:hypothetical protein BDF21DRAFT_359667 [Thamnidium elegans]